MVKNICPYERGRSSPGLFRDWPSRHTVAGTATNVADVAQAHALLHGEEKPARVDAGYVGAAKRGKIKAMVEGPLKQLAQPAERLKASVRARVEHPFHLLKHIFPYRKTHYRGLAKTRAQLHTLFALVNLVIAKRSLPAEVHVARGQKLGKLLPTPQEDR